MNIVIAFILGIVFVFVCVVMTLAIIAFFKVIKLNKRMNDFELSISNEIGLIYDQIKLEKNELERQITDVNSSLSNNVNELYNQLNINVNELDTKITAVSDDIIRGMDSRFNKFETKIKGM